MQTTPALARARDALAHQLHLRWCYRPNCSPHGTDRSTAAAAIAALRRLRREDPEAWQAIMEIGERDA